MSRPAKNGSVRDLDARETRLKGEFLLAIAASESRQSTRIDQTNTRFDETNTRIETNTRMTWVGEPWALSSQLTDAG